MTKDFPPQPGDAFVLRQKYNDQQWNASIRLIFVIAVAEVSNLPSKASTYVHIVTIWSGQNMGFSRYSLSNWSFFEESLVKL